ncbi:shikimate dehydrogenase [Pelagibacteraceae bacterium]|nr:shikimate dehydrogenase [Pelagibacteraceae bacterium]
MENKKYAIIGKPLSHSLSPILHNYWFKKYKLKSEYSLLEINENEIGSTIEKIRSKKIHGINITLPYKQKIIPFVDKLVNDAEKTKSVNTIYLDQENNIVGENTDVYGLQSGYFKQIINKNFDKKTVLVIGAGGVAPSVLIALEKSGIKNISLINRTYDKSLLLKKRFPKIQILKWESLQPCIKNFDIIINATSLGLKGGQDFKVKFENIKRNAVFIDTIYNPLKTKTIGFLESSHVKVFNGLDMFLYQGQKSFYLWNKINPEINDDIINILIDRLKTQ